LVPKPGMLTATVLILVEAGSEYETKNINGLSHFLEHLVFKGTEKRPSSGTIAGELDSLGAAYNAFTSQEYTGYWAKSESKKVGKIIDIISDLYLNPIFNSDEIDRERGVIIEEINLYEDMPMRRVHDIFTDLLYGDQPAGWDIAGRKEIIRRLAREDFIKYRKTHYTAPKTVMVVSGSFDSKEVISQVKGIFSKLNKRKKADKPKTIEKQVRPKLSVKFKGSDQSHLVVGVRAFDIFDKRRYIIKVIADILGGGMSSRLFHEVREKLGAAYYVRAEAELLVDHGYLAVSAGVDHKKIKEVIKIVLREMKRLTDELVEPAELKRSKDHLTGNLVLGLESSDELASFYGGQEILTQSVENPRDLINKVRKVTAEEIKNTAKFIFQNKKLNLAVIGPYRNKDSFRKTLHL